MKPDDFKTSMCVEYGFKHNDKHKKFIIDDRKRI